jgi:hypothetical protein
MFPRPIYLGILYCLVVTGCASQKWLTVQQTAQRSILPPGAPRYSDVCFSSRWERPRDANDTLETFTAAKSFHATYLNWVYTTNPRFIRKADSLGYKLQVALTPTLPDLPLGSTSNLQGRVHSKHGEKVTAPWMKGWNNWWGCVNHPAFQASYFAHIEAALNAGAHGFQVDDPAMGYLLLRNKWEDICYCEFCQKKADSLGVPPPEIQEVSVKEFHQKMKKMAAALAGREVPFSCNNFEGDWELFPFVEFDFGVAEIPERRANPEFIYSTIREARRLGKAQVFTFSNDRDWLVQKMIAATYAAGGNMLVPWDVWQGGGKDRYFGTPKQYAPIYGFVRAIAPWLDGYEDAFYANSQDENRYVEGNSLPISFDNYRRQFHVFARAKPNTVAAPVVVHLLDWHVLMEPFSLKLNERRFFENGIASIELLSPVEYNKTVHEQAEQVGDFSKLAASQIIDFQRDGEILHLKLPKLDLHWGLLILRPKQ